MITKNEFKELWVDKTDLERIELLTKEVPTFKVNVDNDSIYVVIDEDEVLNFNTFGEDMIINLFASLNINAERV